MSDRPVIAVSMGDPGGIGPEVLVKALADRAVRRAGRFHIYGRSACLLAAAERAGIEPYWWRVGGESAESVASASTHDVLVIEVGEEVNDLPRRATAAGGSASFAYVERAIGAGKRDRGDPLKADAIATAPISKAAWDLAGRGRWPGHTELLANRFAAKRVRMMFVAPTLRVMLVTTHLPLMELRNVITVGMLHDTFDLAHESCVGLGVAHPRIAVCGLNPHAGEGGLFGDEEDRLIRPAIRLAQQHGQDVSGPFPADTIYSAAVGGRYDLVVAMYHDQGTIPIKLLAFDSAVNFTAGLPIPRTSPDHGTAYDISGEDRADPGSMRAALVLAAEAAQRSSTVNSQSAASRSASSTSAFPNTKAL